MIRSLAAPLIGLVVMAGSAVSVGAGPISGMFGGDSTLTPASTPGVFTQAYTGDGTDATFGAFTVQSNSIIDFSHPPALQIEDGTFTQTFAEGMLFGTSSGTGTTSGMGTGTATVDVVYTGGTGLFADATGQATILQMIISTGPTTASGSATYSGTLTLVPEPGSLVLLATAVLLFYRRRRGMTAGSNFRWSTANSHS